MRNDININDNVTFTLKVCCIFIRVYIMLDLTQLQIWRFFYHQIIILSIKELYVFISYRMLHELSFQITSIKQVQEYKHI